MKTYNKIVDPLDEFINSLSEKEKQLLLQTISKCYLKYQDSIIKYDRDSIFELNIRFLMAMIIDQESYDNKL